MNVLSLSVVSERAVAGRPAGVGPGAAVGARRGARRGAPAASYTSKIFAGSRKRSVRVETYRFYIYLWFYRLGFDRYATITSREGLLSCLLN